MRWYGVLHLRICKSYLLKTDSNGEAFRHKHSRNLIAWRVLLETSYYQYEINDNLERLLIAVINVILKVNLVIVWGNMKCKIGYGLIVKVVTTNTLQKLILELIFSHSTRV